MMSKQEVESLPHGMRHLRIDPVRKMIVPWFVAWIDGKPEFRMADASKFAAAVNQYRCWVCGQRHSPGRVTYVIGPMCGLNRVSAEPPSHLECARYSARNCPFLAKPQMERCDREAIAAKGDCAGFMIERNPGVTLLWTTRGIQPFSDGKGGTLFAVGEPLSLEFWACGRMAARHEVLHSIETGLPILRESAAKDGPKAVQFLEQMKARFDELLNEWLPG